MEDLKEAIKFLEDFDANVEQHGSHYYVDFEGGFWMHKKALERLSVVLDANVNLLRRDDDRYEEA